MAQERTVGKRPLLDRFGDAVARSLDVSPRLARACLGLGFGYTGLACAHLPDRTCRRSANLAAHLCLDVVSRAYARIGEAAITSIFLPTEVFQALGGPVRTHVSSQLCGAIGAALIGLEQVG